MGKIEAGRKWDKFVDVIRSIKGFEDIPFKIAVEENQTSFLKLTIKVKKQIVATLISGLFVVASASAKSKPDMSQMQGHMKTMQSTMQKMKTEKDPRKKQELMKKHMGEMKAHMAMMSGMMKGMHGKDGKGMAMMGQMGEMHSKMGTMMGQMQKNMMSCPMMGGDSKKMGKGKKKMSEEEHKSHH